MGLGARELGLAILESTHQRGPAFLARAPGAGGPLGSTSFTQSEPALRSFEGCMCVATLVRAPEAGCVVEATLPVVSGVPTAIDAGGGGGGGGGEEEEEEEEASPSSSS